MASNHYSPKSILEEALHKANNAVFFDYRRNFEDAIRAYGQAYSLMGQVVRVSLSDDDRRKLEAIRTSYVRRIYELQDHVAPNMHKL